MKQYLMNVFISVQLVLLVSIYLVFVFKSTGLTFSEFIISEMGRLTMILCLIVEIVAVLSLRLMYSNKIKEMREVINNLERNESA